MELFHGPHEGTGELTGTAAVDLDGRRVTADCGQINTFIEETGMAMDYL